MATCADGYSDDTWFVASAVPCTFNDLGFRVLSIFHVAVYALVILNGTVLVSLSLYRNFSLNIRKRQALFTLTSAVFHMISMSGSVWDGWRLGDPNTRVIHLVFFVLLYVAFSLGLCHYLYCSLLLSSNNLRGIDSNSATSLLKKLLTSYRLPLGLLATTCVISVILFFGVLPLTAAAPELTDYYFMIGSYIYGCFLAIVALLSTIYTFRFIRILDESHRVAKLPKLMSLRKRVVVGYSVFVSNVLLCAALWLVMAAVDRIWWLMIILGFCGCALAFSMLTLLGARSWAPIQHAKFTSTDATTLPPAKDVETPPQRLQTPPTPSSHS